MGGPLLLFIVEVLATHLYRGGFRPPAKIANSIEGGPGTSCSRLPRDFMLSIGYMANSIEGGLLLNNRSRLHDLRLKAFWHHQ